MIKYVSIKLRAENINCVHTEFLSGIPSPVAYLSFVENMLIKTDLLKERPSAVTFGISKFKYLFDNIRSSERLVASGSNLKMSPIKRITKGELETEIMFPLESDLDGSTIQKKLLNIVWGLRFAGGVITRLNILVTPERDKSLIYLLPTFLIEKDEVELTSGKDILKDILVQDSENYEEKNIFIEGYSFLSEISGEKRFKFNEVFTEPILGHYKKRALRKSIFKDVGGWSFHSTNNTIIAKFKKQGEQ